MNYDQILSPIKTNWTKTLKTNRLTSSNTFFFSCLPKVLGKYYLFMDLNRSFVRIVCQIFCITYKNSTHHHLILSFITQLTNVYLLLVLKEIVLLYYIFSFSFLQNLQLITFLFLLKKSIFYNLTATFLWFDLCSLLN